MILIIQNGFICPFITNYLDEEYRLVLSYQENVSLIDIDDYKLIIILGGHQSIINPNTCQYLENVITLIKICFNKNKPLLGICLGSQMIASALGCEIKSSGKLNIGYDTNLFGYQNVFRCHMDYIVPTEKIEILEEQDGMIYAYRYGNNVVGVQCHPDMTPEAVKRFSKCSNSIEYASKNYHNININNHAIIRKLLEMCLID
jgi:GMP synthase-like glutamine amidotransferase